MVVTKYKISVCVDEDTLLKIRDSIRCKRFRNRSHAFEYALNRLFEAEKNG
jgi:hypothetical protein